METGKVVRLGAWEKDVGDCEFQRPQSRRWSGGFPGGAVVETLPDNAGDTGSSPGLGRSHMPRNN